MKLAVILFAALSIVGFSGCLAPGVQKLDAPGESRIAANDVAVIRLSAETRSRVDPLAAPISGKLDEKHPFDTGSIWVKVFVGGADAPAEFSVTKASYKMTIAAAGWAYRYTYTAEGVLHYKGISYPISAEGTRAAGAAFASAARQAVELAAVDAAARCKAIIDQADKFSRSSSTNTEARP